MLQILGKIMSMVKISPSRIFGREFMITIKTLLLLLVRDEIAMSETYKITTGFKKTIPKLEGLVKIENNKIKLTDIGKIIANQLLHLVIKTSTVIDWSEDEILPLALARKFSEMSIEEMMELLKRFTKE